mmetsp:Transcript_12243/g.23005  ORF Transcript_12243/g.23005 Transcript_12243/m.23005 type:complete len:464 (+) Transcript_12243:94-1485(+)
MAGPNGCVPHFEGVKVTRLTQWPWIPCKAALELFDWKAIAPWALRWACYSPIEACTLVAPVGFAAALLQYSFEKLPRQVAMCSSAFVAALAAYTLRPRPQSVLIFKPEGGEQASSEWLAKFVAENRSALHAIIDQYGVLLFRGFHLVDKQDPASPEGLNSCVEAAEQVLEAARMRPTAFFGQAPRWQPEGWRYLFRNVAFEAGSPPKGFWPALRRALGLVWSKAPQYLTFHNEMAYLDTDKHLGGYGVFFCPLASKIGGYTPMSDARRVLARLKLQLGHGFPKSMRWVLARKRKEPVPKKKTGGYLDFLLGLFELEHVKDQFWPTRKVEEIKALVQDLNLDIVETEDEVVVWSKWISPERPLKRGGHTWWCNGNHLAVGSQDVFKRPDALAGLTWVFKFEDGSERAASMSEIVKISWAWWQEATFFKWQDGDLVIFNNQVVAHNATPGVGARMVLPSFGSCWE